MSVMRNLTINISPDSVVMVILLFLLVGLLYFLRDRDSGEQVRVSEGELLAHLKGKVVS